MAKAELTATADDDGNITIRLPASLLAHYVETADDFDGVELVDLPRFAEDLADTLVNDEEEDGTNHLHLAFDSAFARYAEGHLYSDGLQFDD